MFPPDFLGDQGGDTGFLTPCRWLIPSPQPPTAVELSGNGFLPLLIVILLLISKNQSRARLR